jgi:8-oxo-dGTP diphosphatase
VPVTPPRTCRDIDWDQWSPAIRATLVFVIVDGMVLLMRKKRGLGEGKINAPGGKIEAGETAAECALREAREELGVTPMGMAFAGSLRFQFTDGLGIHCEVFRADGHEGEPVETVEGAPIWFPLDGIPYDEMWADDRLWMPGVLENRLFHGDFVFDGDRMLDHDMRWP